MINVTRTKLPPLKNYIKYLRPIWKRRWITNHGPLVCELEDKLGSYLGVKHLALVTNGTIALQIAIKALGMQGDVLTTPFTYVATTSALSWEGCNPIFVDINPDSLCLDPSLIKKRITKNTTGILATHVFGNPCDVEKIAEIAKRNKLKLIYDAAHALGVKYKGTSLLNYGDISTLSLHATKLFHTIEGGAVITNDSDLFKKILYMRNFGHKTPEEFWGVGINGKMSELQAAMGLCLLPEIGDTIRRRKKLTDLYGKLLKRRDLIHPKILENVSHNYSYYPVIALNEAMLLKMIKGLNSKDIYPRRYFSPSLTSLNYVKKQSAPISDDIARRIMCLPLYDDLKESEVRLISDILNKI